MYGSSESTKEKIPPDGKSDVFEVDVLVIVMDCTPTTRSRETSGDMGMVTLLGINRELSNPPKIKLPNTPVSSKRRKLFWSAS